MAMFSGAIDKAATFGLHFKDSNKTSRDLYIKKTLHKICIQLYCFRRNVQQKKPSKQQIYSSLNLAQI